MNAKIQTIMLVSNTIESNVVAFSNIGTALEFVRDSHGDLNPEGSALMLETSLGLVPATNKAVKASYNQVLRFVASDADSASSVALLQSKLDGALQACELVGVDPDNVATVGNLRHAVIEAQANVGNLDNTTDFVIRLTQLHKRKHNAAK